MLDPLSRRLIDPPFDFLGRLLHHQGIYADQVSLAGFFLGLICLPLIIFGFFKTALFFLVVNRFLDGLDGGIARSAGLTDRGGYLDIVCDFIFYTSIPFAFAVYAPEKHALASVFLVFSFMGAGTSFLAYAIFSQKRGLKTTRCGLKSMYYLGGLCEGTETFAALTLMCLFPTYFNLIAWGFGSLCWITCMGRIYRAWHDFKEVYI